MTVHAPITPLVTLDRLPPRARAEVAGIDWHVLTEQEARRLREFGLDEGVDVQLLQRPGMAGGPLACRIGRMTITFRRHVARAIHVTTR